jgi:magnesium-transporting ATPase (P-type)
VDEQPPPDGNPAEFENHDLPSQVWENPLEPEPTPPEVTEIEADAAENLPVDELWNKIGFHKSLGGFYFNLTFLFIDLAISLVFASTFIQWLFPYPDMQGYESIATSIFAIFFVFVTFWFTGCWDQFIPPKRILGVKYMMRYVSFFTWVGIFSGLAQMTIVAIYAFVYAPTSSVAYLESLMAIYQKCRKPLPFRGVR